MNEMKGLTIRGKLLTGFAIIVGLFLIVLGIVFTNLYHTNVYSENVVKIYIPVEHDSTDLLTYTQRMNRAFANWLITRDIKYKSDIDEIMVKIKKGEDRIDATKKDTFTPAEQELWQEVKETIDSLYALKAEAEQITMQPVGANDQAVKFWTGKLEPTATKLSQLINNDDADVQSGRVGFIDLQSKQLSDGIESLVNNNILLQDYVIAMTIITIIISLIVVYITSRKITLPLNNAIEAAQKIAAGDRQVKLQAHTKDETGLLIESLAQMQKSIREGEESLRSKEQESRELLENLVNSAKRMSEHASGVASGDLRERIKLNGQDNPMMSRLGGDLNAMTDGLAVMSKQIIETSHNMVATLEEVRRSVEVQTTGATEQAASINEITASLGEIEKSTSQTIDKARALGKAAKKTQEKGHLGLTSVEESVNGMKLVRDKVQLIAQTILDLSKQTQQVGEITAVVNNLAQQSKMLALNASIEAAKAGESGKGFAVVASEVKNLAEQSEQSTAQVQQILEDIKHSTEKAVMVTEEGTKGVDHGMQLVEQAGEIIRNLNDVIRDATIASQQIEAAITQEGVGIEQITAGMNEINQVTNSLVQSVKQTTEAITNLADISKKLKTTVDIYKV